MKLLYSLLILLYIGNTANAQAYCDGYNLDAARVNYFIKTLSTSGANQNLSLTDGTYPVKATETDLEGYIYDQSQKQSGLTIKLPNRKLRYLMLPEDLLSRQIALLLMYLN